MEGIDEVLKLIIGVASLVQIVHSMEVVMTVLTNSELMRGVRLLPMRVEVGIPTNFKGLQLELKAN